MVSVALFAAALGGMLFGFIADRIGRTRAMIASILVYSLATAACGFAQNIWQLAVFRFILGLGMGGEWASGAALVSETWPPEHRGKALGIMQSGWGVGYAVAAAVGGLLLPLYGWRAVFFAGAAPALLTLWIRTGIEEPKIWKEARREQKSQDAAKFRDLFYPPYRRYTVVVSCMSTLTLFGWWGLFSWIPAYLGQPVSEGGAGLSIVRTSMWVILMQTGMVGGAIGFGFIADRLGRRVTYALFLLPAAALIPIYGSAASPLLLLLLGPPLAFFGNGHFSALAPITAELFPTRIRATAQGFTYNIGRLGSLVAPPLVGFLAQEHGFGLAFYASSVAYTFAAIVAFLLPETKGKVLK
ncbi:MAG: MFS transporter [Acidobacteria bacterium]|nr:MFS transporter [Acidobacteriota bacterium]